MKKLLILILAAGLMTGCVQYKDGKPVNPPEEKVPVVKEEPIPEEKPKKEQSPQQQVEDALANVTHAEVIKVNGQFMQEPYSVQVEYKGKENLTNKMAIKGMKLAVRDALYEIKQLDMNISDVGISVKYPLTDQYGNTEDEYVIKSDFDKVTVDKLNKDKNAFNIANLPDIATSWWEHQAIQ